METLEVIERCLRRPAIFSAGSGVRNDERPTQKMIE